MDDMIFQCHNQNSIYVLNSNYKSYGEFARLNLIESIGVQLGAEDMDKKDLCQHPLTAKAGSRSCSTVSRTLQHKLRNLGNFNETFTEAIGNPLTSSSSSPSSAKCLPAAAIQKLFNCSSVVNNSGSNCNGIVTSTNSCGGSSRRCKDRDSLSSMETEYKNCNKKKCSNVKSSLIAKKTKFLQFLEEEKWGTSNDGIEPITAANCDRQNSENPNARARAATSLPFEFHGYSCVKQSTVDAVAPTSVTTRVPSNNYVKHFAVDAMESSAATGVPQCQSSNWSGSGDSNNQQRQRQQQKWQKSNNNSELYKEAAELLGLSCTLCDNCRCLDCQSSYFDCDDSDNCSELFSMGDYDDDAATLGAMELVMHANYYDEVVTTCCSFQQQQNQQQLRSHANTCCGSAEYNKMLSTQTDENVYPGNAAVSAQCPWHNDNEETWHAKGPAEGNVAHTFRQHDKKKLSPSKTKASHETPTFSKDDRKSPAISAAADPRKSAPNQQQAQQQKQPQKPSLSNELENCANFNELSLADAKDELKNE